MRKLNTDHRNTAFEHCIFAPFASISFTHLSVLFASVFIFHGLHLVTLYISYWLAALWTDYNYYWCNIDATVLGTIKSDARLLLYRKTKPCYSSIRNIFLEFLFSFGSHFWHFIWKFVLSTSNVQWTHPQFVTEVLWYSHLCPPFRRYDWKEQEKSTIQQLNAIEHWALRSTENSTKNEFNVYIISIATEIF